MTGADLKHHRNRYLVAMLAVTVFGAVLRFWHLAAQGYRFADEGYHLLYSSFLVWGIDEPFLYFKHGLHGLLALGLGVLGLDQTGSLRWSALLGTLTLPLCYLLWRQVEGKRVALIALFLVAVSKYVLFYHRSNMSDGYALFVFTGVLLLISNALWRPDVHGAHLSVRTGKRRRWITTVATGLLLGATFTVRIQTCFILVGCVAAWLTALFVRHDREGLRRQLPLAVIMLIAALPGYALVMLALGNTVNWPTTLEWYGKNMVLVDGPPMAWRPWCAIHLWSYCSAAFLGFAIAGLLHRTWHWRRLRTPQLWLVLCCWGLSLGFLKTALPWPRGHLYMVFFLCPFAATGIDLAARLVARRWRRGCRFARAAAIVTLAGLVGGAELAKARVLLTGSGGYGETLRFLLDDNIGEDVFTTDSWPLFRAAHRHLTTVVYDDLKEVCTAGTDAEAHDAFIARLISRHRTPDSGVSHMVLDHTLSYRCDERIVRFVERFVATYPPDLMVRNDFGDDPQTCADAFGKALPESVFSHFNVVYSLRRFASPDFVPLPLAPRERTRGTADVSPPVPRPE